MIIATETHNELTYTLEWYEAGYAPEMTFILGPGLDTAVIVKKLPENWTLI